MNPTACPACGSEELTSFYSVDGVPVNSCLLLGDETSAREFPCGDLRLAVCVCGFITNLAFEPALTTYSQDYEETQGFSQLFREYMTELAKEWVMRYDLEGKTVVEIGCGKGEFLIEMLRAGVGHGVGIDPGLKLDRVDPEMRDRATWINGLFPDDYPALDCDAVICRHTLEHLRPVGEWMRSVREAIGRRTHTVVLFEVPDVQRVLDNGAFWDVYYEHCSYFTAGSLEALFRRVGFEPLDVRRTYDDQYLVIEARPSDAPQQSTADDRLFTLAAADRFAAAQQEMTRHWRSRVNDIANAGGRTVIWGASSKAVAFLTTLGDTARHVAAAVDINPHKHGSYLAGVGHRVTAPQELLDIRPRLIVAMNPAYVSEIRADLNNLGVTASLEAV